MRSIRTSRPSTRLLSPWCSPTTTYRTGPTCLKVEGIGTDVAAPLVAELSKVGQLNAQQVAVLVGAAPFNRDSGKFRGRRMVWGDRQADDPQPPLPSLKTNTASYPRPSSGQQGPGVMKHVCRRKGKRAHMPCRMTGRVAARDGIGLIAAAGRVETYRERTRRRSGLRPSPVPARDAGRAAAASARRSRDCRRRPRAAAPPSAGRRQAAWP
jgi:hypothetical protein